MLTTPELARLIGAPPSTIRDWLQKGWIRATMPAAGRGGENRFDEAEALAIVTMGLARRRGLSPEGGHALYQAVRERPLAETKADIDAGRTHLIVVGRTSTPLCLPGDVAANRLGLELAERLNVPYVVIDVAAAVQKLDAALAEIRGVGGRQLDSSPVETDEAPQKHEVSA